MAGMSKAASLLGVALAASNAPGATAFTAVQPSGSRGAERFRGSAEGASSHRSADLRLLGGLALGGALAVAAGARGAAGRRPKATVVPVGSSLPAAPTSLGYVREQLLAMRAAGEAVPSVEEADREIEVLESAAKQALTASAAAAVVFTGCLQAEAYPIFAQQLYAQPREATGRIVCANCHLASKLIEVRAPHEVLPDTIFKMEIDVPAKYDKRMQPLASGEKGPMNVGAVVVLDEGWKLAPRDRLPKALKKEMKGLAWSVYSKEKPNILVAGPVPGSQYEKMVLPVLAPDPLTFGDRYKVDYGKTVFYFGANRGRDQVYPEGNQSNNNQFLAPAAGTVTSIETDKVTIQKDDGSTVTQAILPGAEIIVEVGEKVSKDEPLTTNPNVGGFGQEEKEVVLQDMNRVYGGIAFIMSCFLSQLAFVLKKKQFEKVQMAEGF